MPDWIPPIASCDHELLHGGTSLRFTIVTSCAKVEYTVVSLSPADPTQAGAVTVANKTHIIVA